MKGTFELRKSEDQHYFVLIAPNGEIILTSEMYTQRISSVEGILSVRTNSTDHSMFDMRKSENDKDYFVLKAKNGEIIGVSEMYESKQGMLNGIDAVQRYAKDATLRARKGNSVYVAGIDPYKEEE